jgi:hypothetical protein
MARKNPFKKSVSNYFSKQQNRQSFNPFVSPAAAHNTDAAMAEEQIFCHSAATGNTALHSVMADITAGDDDYDSLVAQDAPEPCYQQQEEQQQSPVTEDNGLPPDLAEQHRRNSMDAHCAAQRNGLLACLALNVAGTASWLQYAYLSSEQAAAAGIHPAKFALLQTLRQRTELRCYQLGGWPEHLQQAINIGAVKNPRGLKLADYQHTLITQLLPASMYDNENNGIVHPKLHYWKPAQEVPDIASQIATFLDEFKAMHRIFLFAGNLSRATVYPVAEGQPNPLVAQGFATEALPPPVQKPIEPQGLGDAIGLLIGNLLLKTPLEKWEVQPPTLICNIKGLQPLDSKGRAWMYEDYQKVMQQQQAKAQSPPAPTQPEAVEQHPVAGTQKQNSQSAEQKQQASTTENAEQAGSSAAPRPSWWQRNKYWLLGGLTLGGALLYWWWQQRKQKQQQTKKQSSSGTVRNMKRSKTKVAA